MGMRGAWNEGWLIGGHVGLVDPITTKKQAGAKKNEKECGLLIDERKKERKKGRERGE